MPSRLQCGGNAMQALFYTRIRAGDGGWMGLSGWGWRGRVNGSLGKHMDQQPMNLHTPAWRLSSWGLARRIPRIWREGGLLLAKAQPHSNTDNKQQPAFQRAQGWEISVLHPTPPQCSSCSPYCRKLSVRERLQRGWHPPGTSSKSGYRTRWPCSQQRVAPTSSQGLRSQGRPGSTSAPLIVRTAAVTNGCQAARICFLGVTSSGPGSFPGASFHKSGNWDLENFLAYLRPWTSGLLRSGNLAPTLASPVNAPHGRRG